MIRGLNGQTRGGLVLVLSIAGVALMAPCIAGLIPIVTVSGEAIEAPALRSVARPAPWDAPAARPAADRPGWTLSPPIAHDPLSIDLDSILQPPGREHWLGTDELGRDVLARLVHATRPSFLVALIATAISLILGIPVGAVAGYAGPRWDFPLSRLIDASLSFPALILLLLLTALATAGRSAADPLAAGEALSSIVVVGIAVGIVRWGVVARYMRGEVLRLAGSDLSLAARGLGASPARLLRVHLVPLGLGPVIVSAAFGAGTAVVAEASLSFLGLGIQPPAPTWGQMLASSWSSGGAYWWMLAFPGIAIAVTVAAFNLLGEGLRRARPGAGAP